jgi:hypothetical protein
MAYLACVSLVQLLAKLLMAAVASRLRCASVTGSRSSSGSRSRASITAGLEHVSSSPAGAMADVVWCNTSQHFAAVQPGQTPTSGRLHVEPGKQLRIHQRQEHHL